MEEQQPVGPAHRRATLQSNADGPWRDRVSTPNAISCCSPRRSRPVNSTLDLEEVLALVARKVAEALEADACFVTCTTSGCDELVLRATFGTRVEDMSPTAEDAARRGHHRRGGRGAGPRDAAGAAHLDPRFKAFANLREDEYESILAVPYSPARRLLGRSTSAHAARATSPRPRSTCCLRSPPRSRRRSSTRSSTPRPSGGSASSRRSPGSPRPSESLYLEETLEAIVDTTLEAVGASGAALVLEDGLLPGRRGAPVRTPFVSRCGRRAGRLASWSATVTRRSRTRSVRSSPRSPTRRPSRSSTAGRFCRGVLAQEIHHRVKNNLQTVASLLRLQARDLDSVEPRKALDDSVNRVLAIAAVHEVLTERRDDDVDLAELLERLRAMLVQGLGRPSSSTRSSSLSCSPATGPPRSRWYSASCSRTRSSTAARRYRSSWRRATARSCSRSPTTARGWPATTRTAPACRLYAR